MCKTGAELTGGSQRHHILVYVVLVHQLFDQTLISFPLLPDFATLMAIRLNPCVQLVITQTSYGGAGRVKLV